jgi:hypothetical protein
MEAVRCVAATSGFFVRQASYRRFSMRSERLM